MRPRQLGVAVALAAGIGVSIGASAEDARMKWHAPAGAVALPIERINSAPLTVAGLRGKVVLVEFWTYTCINWLRTLPYVRAWAAKYKDQGLVVIGVHSPEFEFEKNIENVRRAVKDLGVT